MSGGGTADRMAYLRKRAAKTVRRGRCVGCRQHLEDGVPVVSCGGTPEVSLCRLFKCQAVSDVPLRGPGVRKVVKKTAKKADGADAVISKKPNVK